VYIWRTLVNWWSSSNSKFESAYSEFALSKFHAC